ncbi:MAG: ATP-binding protein [Candidatus Moranbacteria bacterium]|nr:ATP-binding protein [Candidatus Moranbacteria bacterium]
MTVFKREIETNIRERLFKGKAILLFGPRQAGKTTLSKKLLREYGSEDGYFNCELASVRMAFIPGHPEHIRDLIGVRKFVVFDEAQTIPDIGSILKTFQDMYQDVQVIATGSSSFDLANKINEPLTGRAFEFTLLPLSVSEVREAFGAVSRERIEELMLLGSYPGIVAEKDVAVKKDILRGLATNYLYKDIFAFEAIRNPRVFEDLVRLLALQTGSLVSFNELSQSLGVARATVERYLRLLEQSYVVKTIRTFSRNPRTEIKKGFKVFFYDTGIRNAVLNDLSDIRSRGDVGPLFENFCVSERMKRSLYGDGASVMFWRNRQGAEVDIVEVSGGNLRAFECKWSASAKAPNRGQFLRAYPEATFGILTPDSWAKIESP